MAADVCGTATPRRGCYFQKALTIFLRFAHRFVLRWRYVNMKEQTNPNVSTSYKEVQIGKTLYRVTSVFTGEKDLGQILEQLAVRRAMAELAPCPVN